MVIEKAKRLVEHKEGTSSFSWIRSPPWPRTTPRAVVGQGADRGRRRQRSAAAKRFFGAARNSRKAARCRIIATPDRYRLEDGRGDLRGVSRAPATPRFVLDRKVSDKASSGADSASPAPARRNCCRPGHFDQDVGAAPDPDADGDHRCDAFLLEDEGRKSKRGFFAR